MLLQVDAYFNDNKLIKARFAAHMARKLNMAGFILGVLAWGGILILTGMTVGLSVGLTQDEYDYD